MNFALDENQNELQALATRIFNENVTPDALKAHAATGAPYDANLWRLLADAGLLGVTAPEEAGGLGFGMLEFGLLLEAAGRVLAPAPLLPTGIAARLLAAAGKMDVLGKIATGEVLVALALEDEDGDPSTPSLNATPHEQGWLLRGAKTAVAYGAESDWILLSAQTPDGAALFQVAGNANSLKRMAQKSTHGEPWAHLLLEDTLVPADARLGGADAVERAIQESRAAYAALQIGVADAALRQTAEYTSGRVQFGKPVGSMQGVQQRAADGFIDVEAMRSTTLRALWLIDQGRTDIAEIAVAKYWAAMGGHRVVHTAQHLHGGMGADVEYPIHRYFLNAKPNEIALGGAQQMLALIGREIAEGRTKPLAGLQS